VCSKCTFRRPLAGRSTRKGFFARHSDPRVTHTRTSKYARPESVRTLVRLSVEPFFAGRCSVRAITTALPLRPTDRRSVSDSLKTNCRRDESDFVTRRKVALEFHSPLLLCRNKKKNPRNISNEIGSYDRIVRVNARGNKNDFTSSTHFPSSRLTLLSSRPSPNSDTPSPVTRPDNGTWNRPYSVYIYIFIALDEVYRGRFN